jgi:hypothetical protein
MIDIQGWEMSVRDKARMAGHAGGSSASTSSGCTLLNADDDDPGPAVNTCPAIQAPMPSLLGSSCGARKGVAQHGTKQTTNHAVHDPVVHG